MAIGAQLGAALDMYLFLSWKADKTLGPLTAVINIVISVLGRLNHVVKDDKVAATRQGRPRIFNDARILGIHALAIKCHRLYKKVMALVLSRSL